jgi:uncharacterized protein involved in exopolysaccharide biosynthesis
MQTENTIKENYEYKVDFNQLLVVLSTYKFFIAISVAIAIVASAFYSSTKPTIYKSKTMLSPSQQVSQRVGGVLSVLQLGGFTSEVSNVGPAGELALVRMKTRSFLINFSKKYNLKPIFFFDKYDDKNKKWITKEPSDEAIYNILSNSINVRRNIRDTARIIHIEFKWEDPNDYLLVSEVLNNFIKEINYLEKATKIQESRKSIDFLKKELEKTNLVSFKVILHQLIESEMKSIMFANIKDDYIFSIIDKAIPSKKPEDKNTIIIILISTLIAFFLSFFIAINLFHFRNK